MSKNIDLISDHQYLAKLPAQFNIVNEEKIWWFEKTAIFAAGHLKPPAILATLTVLTKCTYFSESSEEIQECLSNPHVRAMLENLVNSDDPQRDMDAAMREPIFSEFASACLKVVEPDSNQDKETWCW